MYERLMEEVVAEENCRKALQAVVRNKGSAGMDHMATTELEGHLAKHWGSIRRKLMEGTYKPTPVLRVEIEKPGGGKRQLGIPTVLDRFIQQLLVQRLTAIFEATFSESSWGYRPGRSAQQAVKAAQSYLKEGKDWVVDLDIEKFFDRVNHDILMTRIGKIIRDKRVLSLIGKFLRAGVMVEGVVIESVEGTPQGGPLSPLLSNLYLTPLDEELERRGLSFCRFADDSNIYVGSEAAAQRIRTGIQQWIEKHLRLKVNVSKSGYGRPWERKFLGFSFTKRGEIAVAPQSLARLRQRVRQLWDSRQGKTSEQLRKQWQDYIIGWWNYFKLAQWRQEVFNCEGWIRRHIRKCFWLRWHNKRGRLRKLRRLGVYGPPLQIAGSSRGAWPVAATPTLQWAMSNARLRQYHFWVPSDLAKLKP